MVQKDGRTLRANLEPLARRGNVEAIKTITGPDFPDPLAYLWSAFLELDATRQPGFSLSAITQLDIKAYQENMQTTFAPHEVRAIVRVDQGYRKALSENK